MIPSDKMREIVTALKKQTAASKITWGEVSLKTTLGARFQCNFPSSSTIVLSYFTPEVEENYLSLRIVNENNQPVGALQATKRQEDWGLLEELYGIVERQVTGWDKVLKDLQDRLGIKRDLESKL